MYDCLLLRFAFLGIVTVNSGLVATSVSSELFLSLKSARWIVFSSGGGALWSRCEESRELPLLFTPDDTLWFTFENLKEKKSIFYNQDCGVTF